MIDDELTVHQKRYRARRSPAYLRERALAARKWRAENRERHREAEKARYRQRMEDDPDGLRKERSEYMRKWRAENRERSNATTRRSNAKNKEKLRDRRYQKKYGLSSAECDAMLAEQEGKCGICRSPDSPRGWCVDHCHSTGAVRGILCHDCNTGIGFFKDDVTRLQSAIDYLAR